jgi:hypothetical protein
MNQRKRTVSVNVMILLLLISICLSGCETVERMASKSAIDPELSPKGIDQTIVFTNINVIPMDSERVLERQTVVVSEGHIAKMDSGQAIQVPTGALVIDGEGKFLIPGLNDMHMHLDGSENDLLLYLANGVTTVRDMGDGPSVYLQWRDEISEGIRTGPNMVVMSPSIKEQDAITAIDEYRFFSGGVVNATTAKKAEKLVSQFAAQGYDGIKTKYNVTVEVYQTLQESARRHGLLFDGHVPEAFKPGTANSVCPGDPVGCWNAFRKLGIEAIAHADEIAEMARGASQDFIRKVAQEVAADGIWVSTTFALLPDLPQQIYHLEETLARMPEVKYLNPWIYNAKWDPKKNEWPERAEKEDMAWVPLYIDMVEKMLVALKDAGALLLSGTDAAIPFIVPGFGLHDELEALVSIGFSPYDALRTSTYNPAKYLGALRELGTVKVGKRADIVVLEGNPLEDINNTRKINGVMVRGRWFARGDLDLMLELVADANLGND